MLFQIRIWINSLFLLIINLVNYRIMQMLRTFWNITGVRVLVKIETLLTIIYRDVIISHRARVVFSIDNVNFSFL